MTVRVLQVVGGSKFGGAVWVVLSYVEALQEHGCEVTVCSSVEPVADVFRGAGCEIVSIDEMTREIPPLAGFGLARETHEGLSPRRIRCRSHAHLKGWVHRKGRGASRRTPVVLHTAHGFAFHESSSPVATALYTRLERLAGRWSDRVLTVSDFHRQWAIQERLAPPDRIVTVRNGSRAEGSLLHEIESRFVTSSGSKNAMCFSSRRPACDAEGTRAR